MILDQGIVIAASDNINFDYSSLSPSNGQDLKSWYVPQSHMVMWTRFDSLFLECIIYTKESP